MAQRNTIVSKRCHTNCCCRYYLWCDWRILLILFSSRIFSRCCCFIKIQRSPLMHPQNILPIRDISIGPCQFSMCMPPDNSGIGYSDLQYLSGVIENDCEMFCIIGICTNSWVILGTCCADQTAWISCSTLLCIYF